MVLSAGGAAPLSILRAAEEAPDRIALVVEDEALTYAGASERVLRVMSWLARRGVRAERASRVAVLAGRSPTTILTMHALMELGVPFVPISTALTAAERDRILVDSGAEPFIDEHATSEAFAADTPPAALGTLTVPEERDLAIPFTSGTTGRAKGVALTRRAFLASAEASAANLGWQDDDRWLLCLPPSHVGGLSVVVRCLVARRTVVIMREARFEAPAVTRTISEKRVTLMSLVPTQLEALLALEPAWKPPSHLRAVLLGGAHASAGLLSRAVERGVPVLTTYGLTEACSQVTTQRYGTTHRGERGAGVPLGGTEVRVVEGVIHVRGPTLMRAYVPEGEHPDARVDGWLVTNDLGRIDEEGFLHVLGRRDDVIVTGGENVAPLEVEQALEALPFVHAACVFGVPDARWGEVVAAAIVPSVGAPETLGALEPMLRAQLASYKRPRMLAVLSELAHTPSGKIDRMRTKAAAMPLLRAL